MDSSVPVGWCNPLKKLSTSGRRLETIPPNSKISWLSEENVGRSVNEGIERLGVIKDASEKDAEWKVSPR